MPIFLGRKKRDVDLSVDARDGSETSYSDTPVLLTTESYAEENDDIKIPSTTETISFTLDGRPEKYIVARHVDVDISYEDPDEDFVDTPIDGPDQGIQENGKRSEI